VPLLQVIGSEQPPKQASFWQLLPVGQRAVSEQEQRHLPLSRPFFLHLPYVMQVPLAHCVSLLHLASAGLGTSAASRGRSESDRRHLPALVQLGAVATEYPDVC
jgi:hypothetical protein